MGKMSGSLSKLFLKIGCSEHCSLLELNDRTISELVSQKNSLKRQLDYLKCYESINELLERNEHLILFRKMNNGTAVAVSLFQSKNGHNDFFIYLIGFLNRINKKIGECSAIISLNKETEELFMKIVNTKILDEYQGRKQDGIYVGNHYGEILVDEVFKYARSIGVKKIYGERTVFDTSTKNELNRWNAFWIGHYKCTSTATGFYKILYYK